MSLAILLGACDDSCCCTPVPETNLGTIYILPDLLSSTSKCKSPLTEVALIDNVFIAEGTEYPCSDSWTIDVVIYGTENKCEWSKNFSWVSSVKNMRLALRVDDVPLRDVTIQVSVKEPKHDPVGSTCTQCTNKYFLRYFGSLLTSLTAGQIITVSCADRNLTECCN
jgi:hypothetical protein